MQSQQLPSNFPESRFSSHQSLVTKLATPISNGGLFGTPPGFCTDTCLWQV